MKRTIGRFCVFSLLLLSPLAHSVDGPKRSEDGVFVELVATHQQMGRLVYIVDSIARPNRGRA